MDRTVRALAAVEKSVRTVRLDLNDSGLKVRTWNAVTRLREGLQGAIREDHRFLFQLTRLAEQTGELAGRFLPILRSADGMSGQQARRAEIHGHLGWGVRLVERVASRVLWERSQLDQGELARLSDAIQGASEDIAQGFLSSLRWRVERVLPAAEGPHGGARVGAGTDAAAAAALASDRSAKAIESRRQSLGTSAARLRRAGESFEARFLKATIPDRDAEAVRQVVLTAVRIVDALSALQKKLATADVLDAEVRDAKMGLAKTAGHHANRLAEVLERIVPSAEDAPLLAAALGEREDDLRSLLIALNFASDQTGDDVNIDRAAQDFRVNGPALRLALEKISNGVSARKKAEAAAAKAREAKAAAAREAEDRAAVRAQREGRVEAKKREAGVAEARWESDWDRRNRGGGWGGGWTGGGGWS